MVFVLTYSDSLKNPTSVLFLGREGCYWSAQILSSIESFGCEVEYVESAKRREQLPGRAIDWSGDLIFSFRSFYILTAEQVNSASLGAINFHPGPPEYPGSGCINWALLDAAESFGVTAHLMTERIDSGKILAVDRFSVESNDNLSSLLKKTHEALGLLALQFIDNILKRNRPDQIDFLSKAAAGEWSGKARPMTEIESLQNIPSSISPQDLAGRIRALHLPAFPVYTEIAGHKFTLDIG